MFAGDFKAGEIDGKTANQNVYLGMAIIMDVAIIMVVLSLVLDYPISSWINIIAANIFILFNLLGMKGMKSYDKFLIMVSFGLNIVTIWYALTRRLF